VEPDFLEQMNNAYEQAGTKALQAHRLSRNRDTSAARLDAIFEEINNAIFRRGHIVLGFSAAISGSGMLFEFEWFKRSIMEVHNAIGEDKELEAILMRESVFVDYFDNIHVYDEKARTTSKFNDQRKRWAFAQLHALFSNLKYLPKAFLGRHYDHLDKLIQWMLVPRTIMIGVIMVMCAILPFIYMTSAVKWWAVAALALFAFSLATPDYLVDKNWDTDFLLVPVVTIWGIFNIFRIGKTEVSTRMNSLRRTVKRLTPIIKFRHD
jgi:cellulose synthase/poly-beta-1,6-N-acetylglucosamine synthase-like glycosyltransferase